MIDLQQATLAVCATVVAYALYKRYRASTISDIPGPKNPSWRYGHAWWWQREEAGAVDKMILEEYGTVARWNGSLGEERLWIADPKAIHHILHSPDSLYVKPSVHMEKNAMLTDRGVAAVEGDAHKRQRRAMAPAFGLVEAKALYPYFVRCSNSLADKWNDIVSNTESRRAVIVDVHSWLAKATLDVIGAGAFEYDFGALENTDNKLTKSYTNLAFDAFASPPKGRIFMMDAVKFAPKGFLTWMMERDKSPGIVQLRENRTRAHEVVAKLIEDKRQELKNGTSRKDLLSLLVKANSAPRPDWRLQDDEIVAQFRSIMFAGHETISRALTFCLWELAKNRLVQETLRAEIMETLRRIRARGGVDFTVGDFDSMPYLLAVGKEISRMHPIGVDIQRVSKKDDILPLTTPVVGVSGKVYNELPIPAGTFTNISTIGHNLNKQKWGRDAYEFRPERWFEISENSEPPVGVYSNLATFSGGRRSCIGWRFAVIDMNTFLVTLIRQFEFFLPENGQEVRGMSARPGGVLAPIVVGEEHKGPQMPLKVTALRNE